MYETGSFLIAYSCLLAEKFNLSVMFPSQILKKSFDDFTIKATFREMPEKNEHVVVVFLIFPSC